MEAIHYKGWIIIEETDPWAIKYGSNYRFFPEGEEGNGEVIRSAKTIDEAKDEISEKVFLAQYPEQWYVKHSEVLSPAPWDFLEDAMRFAVKFNALQFDHFNAP